MLCSIILSHETRFTRGVYNNMKTLHIILIMLLNQKCSKDLVLHSEKFFRYPTGADQETKEGGAHLWSEE